MNTPSLRFLRKHSTSKVLKDDTYFRLTTNVIPLTSTTITCDPDSIGWSVKAGQIESPRLSWKFPAGILWSMVTVWPTNCLTLWFSTVVLSWSLSWWYCLFHQSHVVNKAKKPNAIHCSCHDKSAFSDKIAPTMSADEPSQRKKPAVPNNSKTNSTKPKLNQCQKLTCSSNSITINLFLICLFKHLSDTSNGTH